MRRVAGLALILLVSSTAITAAAQRRVDPLVESTDDTVILQRYGIEFYRQNRPHDAVDALQKALRLYPDNAETHMWLGVVYTSLAKDEVAEGEFVRALELNPQLTEAHNWFGLYWVHRGDLRRAIDHYRTALADPAYPRLSRARVLLNLGTARLQLGDVEEAISPLSEARRSRLAASDPAFLWVRLALGEALVRNGRPQEALAVLEEIDQLAPSGRGELLMGMAYRDLGEKDRARDHLRDVLRLEPGSELADRARGILDSLDSGQN